MTYLTCAQHFVDCIKEARALSPNTLLEILVPDFRGRMDIALRIMTEMSARRI